MKWSYAKVFGWSLVVAFVSLIVYVHLVMSSAEPVSSTSGETFAFLLLVIFLLSEAAVWRHNHAAYARAFAKWDRQFVCMRCGATSE